MRRTHVIALGLALAAVVAALPACSGEDAEGCANGVRDGDEVGLDCGGSCGKCTADACIDGAECKSGSCTAGVCAASVDKPCGVGTGRPCNDAEGCEIDGDCTTDVCESGRCIAPGPTVHADGRRNAGETGVDCGGSVKSEKPCAEGQGCKDASDCVGGCSGDKCTPIGPADGKKNNGETDVDCGGMNAPGCSSGKTCTSNEDCEEKYCPAAARRVCVAPRADDGVMNGSETDVDCGGKSGVLCDPGKNCLIDTDCTSTCNYAKKCVESPSCRPRMGGDTCGPGEVEEGGSGHESCCRSLLVADFEDPTHAGKKVYLDKYEVTAGRVRAFIEAMKAANGADIKTWLTANRPPIWQDDWSPFLPSSMDGQTLSVPHKPTSGSEAAPWFRNVGVNYQFNGQLFVYVHGHNCGNGEQKAYGYGTYWYPPDVMLDNGSPYPRTVPQDQLDVKAMTCVPNAMLAAFCAWDGGQLATDEVLDYVTNAPPSLGGSPGCGTRCATSGINVSSDGGQTSVYNYPYEYGGVNETEGVSRIAPPGRIEADVVRLDPADEPWMDLAGNLNEIALDTSNGVSSGKFTMRYRGIGFNSARGGGNTVAGNIGYPEYKAGYSGGRCMRFR